jgi:hypothetical protein
MAKLLNGGMAEEGSWITLIPKLCSGGINLWIKYLILGLMALNVMALTLSHFY